MRESNLVTNWLLLGGQYFARLGDEVKLQADIVSARHAQAQTQMISVFKSLELSSQQHFQESKSTVNPICSFFGHI